MTPEALPVTYTLKRADIVAAARRWVGTPYRHQGRGANGMDCVGLLCAVAEDMGHPVVAPTAYSNMPQGHQLLVPCEQQLWRPSRNTIRPGDLAVFWGWSRKEPQHFAFIGDAPGGMTVIHSYSKFNAVVEQSWGRAWEMKFWGIYCLPGTENA